MKKNLHRWKRWIDDYRICNLLEEAAEALDWAWKVDKKAPKKFPLNTWYLFIQIDEQLENKPVVRPSELAPRRPTPRKLYDLVPESAIKAVYEDHNEGGY